MTTSAYLSEEVEYGGLFVTRGEMIADLQAVAKSQFPADPARQQRMVEAYMMGDMTRRAIDRRVAR